MRDEFVEWDRDRLIVEVVFAWLLFAWSEERMFGLPRLRIREIRLET